MATKRSIAQRGKPVSNAVRYAIDLLENRYGAPNHRDSGHTEARPTWAFELPRYGAVVGRPMNQPNLSLHRRNRTLDVRKLADIPAPELVSKVYPRDGRPRRNIKDSPFLDAAAGNECVLLRLDRSDLEPLFETFLALPAPAPKAPPPDPTSSASPGPGAPPSADAEAYEALLERRSEVGRAGEMLVVLDEIERLSRAGCADPDCWVERVAESDVGRGYDIASTWPVPERYIEVKSTTSAGSDFLITDNERKVLGAKVWLYRVVLASDGTGTVSCRMPDPTHKLPDEAFEPVLFHVSGKTLS